MYQILFLGKSKQKVIIKLNLEFVRGLKNTMIIVVPVVVRVLVNILKRIVKVMVILKILRVNRGLKK